ncbi:hypothetical protein [Heliobacterium chlorum]|uniref:hypothetical protein n=1 Tax=Heliobacterium chlorum TaxID=2698 RepID=UPI00165E208F|nr:hypothetical protein [Heliobacterium chlorum]
MGLNRSTAIIYASEPIVREVSKTNGTIELSKSTPLYAAKTNKTKKAKSQMSTSQRKLNNEILKRNNQILRQRLIQQQRERLNRLLEEQQRLKDKYNKSWAESFRYFR